MDQTSPSALWNSLVTSALIGSKRQQIDIPSAAGPLGEVISALDSSNEPEAGFLATAGAVSLYLDAGRLPLSVFSNTNPSEPDKTPSCKPASVWILKEIFSSNNDDLLTELLSVVSHRGKRVPEEMLPSLLDYGAKSAYTRDRIISILGNRGRWLAACNSDWSYVLTPDTEDIWLTGAKDHRLAFIRRLRGTNPARASELASSTWNEEPPEIRAAIINAFRTGLSMHDEPFLEQSLDDRRKEVRRAAAELLSSLPTSALCRRMIDRAKLLISWNGGQKLSFLGIGRKCQLEVNLPKECTKDMIRDGIELKPPQGTGEKAWWLLQVISAVPPSMWCGNWNVSPGDLINAAMQTEWKTQILSGWAKAAERHRDVDFAEVLLGAILNPSAGCEAAMEGLVGILPADRLERLIMSNIRSGYSIKLLSLCNHYWSPDLSKAVIPVIQQIMSGKTEANLWQAHPVIARFSNYISVSVYADASACLSSLNTKDDGWNNLINKFLSILKFRHDMLEAI